MATGRAFSGKEFEVRLGIRDQSATALGTAVSTGAHTLTPVVYRLNGLNDIAWDGGYQRAELDRSGTRMKRAEDIEYEIGEDDEIEGLHKATIGFNILANRPD